MSVMNLMLRPKIKNRSFEWMGETFTPLMNGHFLGRSALGHPKAQPDIDAERRNISPIDKAQKIKRCRD